MDENKNYSMFTQSYADLIEVLSDLTYYINSANDINKIDNEDLEKVNIITTILKRMGETSVMEKY